MERRSAIYRGAAREDAEAAYHDDAVEAAADGFVPASETWSTALGHQVLTVDYVYQPDQAPVVISELRHLKTRPKSVNPPSGAPPLESAAPPLLNAMISRTSEHTHPREPGPALTRARRFGRMRVCLNPIFTAQRVTTAESRGAKRRQPVVVESAPITPRWDAHLAGATLARVWRRAPATSSDSPNPFAWGP